MIQHIVKKTLPLWIALAIATSGCDERVARISQEAADRQADQNKAMARLQQHVADGARSLVEADADARRDFVAVHRDLQSERQTLNRAWNAVEVDRREVARDRRTESLLEHVIPMLGWGVLLAALLGFLRQVLHRSTATDEIDAQLNELLIQELLESSGAASESEPLPPSLLPAKRLPAEQ